jgi:hypothetical protein
MRSTIQRRPAPVGKALSHPTKGITGLVYRSVRGGVRLIGAGVDVSLASVVRFLPQGETAPGREALLVAVNGVYGDYLARTGNPLAIEMSLRSSSEPSWIRGGERLPGSSAWSRKIATSAPCLPNPRRFGAR